MTRSDQLRLALSEIAKREDWGDWPEDRLIHVAARFALRVWEGDEQLVETVRDVIENIAVRDEFDFEIPVGVSDEMARAVLAAIRETVEEE